MATYAAAAAVGTLVVLGAVASLRTVLDKRALAHAARPAHLPPHAPGRTRDESYPYDDRAHFPLWLGYRDRAADHASPSKAHPPAT